jgi:hypothetical protein
MKTGKNIFFPIDLSVLRIDEVNPFNFYLKTGLANNEYVLYSKKGSRFTKELRLKLISNGVKIIYIPDTDHMAYLEYVEWNLQNIVNDKSISAEEKSKLVYNSSNTCFQSFSMNRGSRPFFAQRKSLSIWWILSLIFLQRLCFCH